MSILWNANDRCHQVTPNASMRYNDSDALNIDRKPLVGEANLGCSTEGTVGSGRTAITATTLVVVIGCRLAGQRVCDCIAAMANAFGGAFPSCRLQRGGGNDCRSAGSCLGHKYCFVSQHEGCGDACRIAVSEIAATIVAGRRSASTRYQSTAFVPATNGYQGSGAAW